MKLYTSSGQTAHRETGSARAISGFRQSRGRHEVYDQGAREEVETMVNSVGRNRYNGRYDFSSKKRTTSAM